ncbi:hypothetical protein ACFYKX_05180 [Cytobacillus sp. FJAT-54145]|uniref:Uncharacterized protein n=1 Tax=Cytobacillus spartinae TaxID=3299023 RepID=A0ABW6K754_9BACI
MNNKIMLENVYGKTPFHGNGKLTGIKYNLDKSVIAVVSEFSLYGWAGRKLENRNLPFRYRVQLYNIKTLESISCLDVPYPINEIAFHPQECLVFLGTGSFDGGFLYEGELLNWDYHTGELFSLLEESREIISVNFDEKDDMLNFTVSPEDDWENKKYKDLFVYKTDDFYNKQKLNNFMQIGTTPKVNKIYSIQSKKRTHSDCSKELKKLCPEYEYRANIWDIKWRNGEDIFCVGESPFLEKWNFGKKQSIFHEKGRGCQLFISSNKERVYVHSEEMELNAELGFDLLSGYLSIYNPSDLEIESKMKQSFPHFIVHKNKVDVFLVMDEVFHNHDTKKRVYTSSLDFITNYEMDDCDRFISVEDEDFFFKSTKERIIKFNRENNKQTNYSLSEIVKGPTHEACQTEPGTFIVTYGERDVGYNIMKIEIETMKVIWTQLLPTQVIVMRYMKEKDVVVCSLASGKLVIISESTGEVKVLEEVIVDKCKTMILSLDIYGDRVAAGTIDGLVLCYHVS